MIEHIYVPDEYLSVVCEHYFRRGRIYPIPPDRIPSVPLNVEFLYDEFHLNLFRADNLELLMQFYEAYAHLELPIMPCLIGMRNPKDLERLNNYMQNRTHLLTFGPIEIEENYDFLVDGSTSMEQYPNIDVPAFIYHIYHDSLAAHNIDDYIISTHEKSLDIVFSRDNTLLVYEYEDMSLYLSPATIALMEKHKIKIQFTDDTCETIDKDTVIRLMNMSYNPFQ